MDQLAAQLRFLLIKGDLMATIPQVMAAYIPAGPPPTTATFFSRSTGASSGQSVFQPDQGFTEQKERNLSVSLGTWHLLQRMQGRTSSPGLP